MAGDHRPVSSILAGDTTGEQLALASSERVTATTRHGPVIGGRTRNGCQAFLNVPYGLEVLRWEDPKPLPEDWRYPAREYTKDALYPPPPEYELPQEEGKTRTPTECPFYLDIYVPAAYRLGVDPANLPVKVFIHGGFFQGGSTFGGGTNQQFFAANHFNEVRVVIEYRLGVLGFLASRSWNLAGNYGTKDAWMGLEWIQRNIHSFGGDANNVHLSGQSAGAHLIDHMLQHAAAKAPLQKAPFVTATLHSNAILENPPTPADMQTQFESFCKGCGISAARPNTLDSLRDTVKLPGDAVFHGVRSMGTLSSFIPCVGGDDWLPKDEIERQRNGSLAKDLLAAGVKCIIIGDVKDEDKGYKNSNDCSSVQDIKDNWCRWNSKELVEKLYDTYPPLPEGALKEDYQTRLGDCLGDARVRISTRMLAEDLVKGGMPVVRYTVENVAYNQNTEGIVTHGSDLVFHFLRLSVMNQTEAQAALHFLKELYGAVDAAVKQDGSYIQRKITDVLAFEPDRSVKWRHDWRWDKLKDREAVVRKYARR